MPVGGDAAAHGVAVEHRVDRREHGLRRAVGRAERHRVEPRLYAFSAFEEHFARIVERVGVGALETEDGLLAVAHGEDGARHIGAGAAAGMEFLGQRLHDIPLGA